MTRERDDARVPDIVLERYRLGELAAAEAAGLERKLEGDAGLRERLAALADSDAQIARVYPAEWFAERVRARLPPPAAPGLLRRRRSPLRVLVATAAVAAVLVVAVRPRVFAPGMGGPTLDPPRSDTRIKGQTPGLALFRKAKDGSEVLEDGALARPGDLIRIGYRAAGRRYGAILSADGRGTVTLHLPPRGQEAVALKSGPTVLLDQAYELDDAPRWERFYLVTGDAPFSLAPVLEAAREAATSAAAASPPALRLPPSLDQAVFSLEKGSPR